MSLTMDNLKSSNNRYSIAFIVLHYIDYDCTVNCVDSILALNRDSSDVHVFIVDNCSPNDSGERLKRTYKTNRDVDVFGTNANLGFANGNNYGYEIAKRHGYDFLIHCNNDLLFKQNDFMSALMREYEANPFHICGPDIYNPLRSIHQSPMRIGPDDRETVQRWLSDTQESLYKLRANKLFQIETLIRSTRLYLKLSDIKHSFGDMRLKVWEKPVENAVLQGSCVVFSPLYVRSMDWAFYPRTFMYAEEGMLNYVAIMHGYRIVYLPALQVHHLHGVSTKASFASVLDRREFYYKNLIDSYGIYVELIDSGVCNE